jgi:1-acyl-sn-glycerol-3-phosphate acyltransferase
MTSSAAAEPIAVPTPPTLKSRLIYGLTRVLAAPIFTLGFSFRYQANRKLPKTGPLLIIANHQSYLDPPLVGLAFDRQLIYLARKTLFRHPLFRAMIEGLNAVPIDQEGIGKEGLKAILDELGRGKTVLVFPEGSRTPDGAIHELRGGIHLLIKKSPAPIVPVGIAGAYDAWPIWRKYPILSPLFLPPTKRTIAVVVGEPLNPSRYSKMPRDEAMSDLFGELVRVHARAEALRRK